MDLDNNRVHLPQSPAPFPQKEVTQLTWELQRLVNYEIACNDYPGYNPARNIDQSCQFTNFVPPVGPVFNEYPIFYLEIKIREPEITIRQYNRYIRLVFLKFFGSMFQDYRKYLMFLRVFPKPVAVFNKIDFLKSKPDATVLIDIMLILYLIAIHRFIGFPQKFHGDTIFY